MHPAPAIAPPRIETEAFTDPAAAVARLIEIYERNTGFLRGRLRLYERDSWQIPRPAPRLGL